MSVGGWILLVGSMIFVWGLAGWCYWKILSGPGGEE
jgi:hypothetical protein